MRDAILAEFSSPEDLVLAIGSMREAGITRLDAYTPYPLDSVENALALQRSRLPKLCAAAAFLGAAGAYFLQWLLEAHLYPLNSGGRPVHFPLAFFIITFEMGVLAAGLTAFFGVLFTCRLLTLWDPVDEIDGFESASNDRYWLTVTGRDARDEDAAETQRRLGELGSLRVVRIRAGKVL